MFGTRDRLATRGRVLMATMSLLVAAPCVAHACNIPIRSVGPIDVGRSAIRTPVERVVPRSRWRLDERWVSTTPQLNQTVRTKRAGTWSNASFTRQRYLSIDAVPPGVYGFVYTDDQSSSTPACAMQGQTEWLPPVVRIREAASEIRVTAAAMRRPGDRTGCVLQGESTLACPQLTTKLVRLKAPVGARRIVFERFAEDEDSL